MSSHSVDGYWKIGTGTVPCGRLVRGFFDLRHGGVFRRIRVHCVDEEIDIVDEHEALGILRQLSELVGIETGAESSHVIGFDAVSAARGWRMTVLSAVACLKPLNEQPQDLFDRVGGGWISLAQVMIKLFGGGVHGLSLANGLRDSKV